MQSSGFPLKPATGAFLTPTVSESQTKSKFVDEPPASLPKTFAFAFSTNRNRSSSRCGFEDIRCICLSGLQEANRRICTRIGSCKRISQQPPQSSGVQRAVMLKSRNKLQLQFRQLSLLDQLSCISLSAGTGVRRVGGDVDIQLVPFD